MKKIVAVAFALFVGAFVFGFSGHSYASPASAAVTAAKVEATKSDVTPVHWRYYRRCYTYRVWVRRYRCGCYRPRRVCGGCCNTGFLGWWFW